MSATGLGKRCKRFSALVRDSVVATLNFEPDGGKGISVTGAATMLEQI
jgi:peroxiredoxin